MSMTYDLFLFCQLLQHGALSCVAFYCVYMQLTRYFQTHIYPNTVAEQLCEGAGYIYGGPPLNLHQYEFGMPLSARFTG